MATPLDNLQDQYANAVTRLAELDSLTTDQIIVFTYSEGGRTFGFNEYRASLQATVNNYAAQIEGLLKAQQMIGGPFTVIGHAGCW